MTKRKHKKLRLTCFPFLAIEKFPLLRIAKKRGNINFCIFVYSDLQKSLLGIAKIRTLNYAMLGFTKNTATLKQIKT